jgi:hypothetical protein
VRHDETVYAILDAFGTLLTVFAFATAAYDLVSGHSHEGVPELVAETGLLALTIYFVRRLRSATRS